MSKFLENFMFGLAFGLGLLVAYGVLQVIVMILGAAHRIQP